MKVSVLAGIGLGLALAVAASAQSAELAKVNGKSITDGDLKQALSGFSEAQKASILKDSSSRRQVLLDLVDREVLVQEGEKAKLDQQQEYKDAMAAFRKQYLTNKILEREVGKDLTDKKSQDYYKRHKARFSTDQIHVQHILVDDEARAKTLLAQAQAKDADFLALAEKNSKDPSAKNNRGDLTTAATWDSFAGTRRL
jgi:peptidyl-prolyl cis-trans isomerase C